MGALKVRRIRRRRQIAQLGPRFILWCSATASADLIGCRTEYEKFTPIFEDTAPPLREPPEDDCYDLEAGEGLIFTTPKGDWKYDGVCTMQYLIPSYDDWVRPGSYEIATIKVNGYEGSLFPDSKELRIVLLDYSSASGYPSDGNPITSVFSAVATSDGWTGAPSSLNELNDCTDHCEYVQFALEIKDQERWDAHTCSDYTPPVEMCINWTLSSNDSGEDRRKRPTSVRRMAPISAKCAPGSGQFQLVPTRAVNNNNDSNSTLVLRPVQTSGFGALTGAAWINIIDIVEDQGLGLSVIRLGESYRFDSLDRLIDPDRVALELSAPFALDQRPTIIPDGIVTGSTPFILQNSPIDMNPDLRVNLEWSCGSLRTNEIITPSQGYTFSLQDVGCLGVSNQKVTVRPFADHLNFELYGMSGEHIRVPLLRTPSGATFNYHRAGVDIGGSILSNDRAGAQVALDHAAFMSVPLCVPNTYFIPAEE